MAQQTNYYDNPPPALAGMLAPQEGEVIWSKIAGSAVGIGLLASIGTTSFAPPSASSPIGTASGDAGTVIPLATTADDPILDSDFIGIPIWDPALMASDQIGTGTQGTFSYSTYLAQIAVPLLRKGRIWVYSAQATTQNGDVYVYGTAQTNNPTGQFGYGTGTGKVKFGRGRWLMTTSAAGLSLMEVW